MARLAEQLAALGLRYTAAHLDDVVALATKRRWSATQLLEHLADTEHRERTRRTSNAASPAVGWAASPR